MRVEVVVPWRGGCHYRERAWRWVRGRYEATFPGWTVTEASCPEGPWVKAAAVVPAIRASAADIIVVADADCWTDGIATAVDAVASGEPWAIPHLQVVRLSQAGTEAVYRGEPWQDQELDQRPYQGIEGGGFIVAWREVLDSIPLDQRFVGWGQEDMAAAVALRTLLGPPWRGRAPLIHLYHPPQPRMTRRRGSPDSWRLYRRYANARTDHRAMRLLIEESR